MMLNNARINARIHQQSTQITSCATISMSTYLTASSFDMISHVTTSILCPFVTQFRCRHSTLIKHYNHHEQTQFRCRHSTLIKHYNHHEQTQFRCRHSTLIKHYNHHEQTQCRCRHSTLIKHYNHHEQTQYNNCYSRGYMSRIHFPH